MGVWDAWIGRTEVRTDLLTPALVERFRATIDSDLPDDPAPQGVHWLTCVPDAPTAALGEDGHPARTDSDDSFFPPIPLPRRMWASSKVEFVAPISAGASIIRTSTIASIAEKSGSSGALAFVDVAHDTMADGALAIREVQTLVYRAAANPPGPGVGTATLAQTSPTPPLKGRGVEEWQFHRTLTPSEALLFRYSALTFNTHRIHYDAPYAREIEAYRGLVVHGPLMASLLLDLVAREFGANALKRFAFRAQSPAFANEPLTLAGKRDGDALTLAALGPDGAIRLSAEGSL